MKKKTLIYFLVPLLGLLGFGAVYWNFNAGYEAKEAAKVAAIKHAKELKLQKEAHDREVAIKDAIAAQDRRKAEKAAKEAKDKADREARQAAVDARDKAYRDQQRLDQQVQRLTKDVTAEKEAIAKLEEDKKRSADEFSFLKEYVKQAESNTKHLTEVIEKIGAADQARAAADAAAAKPKNS
jgi:colicin import membrane protein